MHACTELNLADRDFFIRKAIGWAQRAYAWTDPDKAEHRQRPTQPGTHPAGNPPSREPTQPGTAVAVERFTNA
jgi:hypothetical protein